jgi:hypothetical protein
MGRFVGIHPVPGGLIRQMNLAGAVVLDPEGAVSIPGLLAELSNQEVDQT